MGQQTTVHLNPQFPGNGVPGGQHRVRLYGHLSRTRGICFVETLLPLEFPNIITPNGDLVNDLWNPPLPAGFADCTRLTLYNRWGNEVFDSRQFPVAWNGKTASGNALTDGVYFYILEIGGVYKKGTVTLTH